MVGCYRQSTPFDLEQELLEKYHLANEYYEKNDYENAISLYKEVLAKRDLIADVYKRLAVCYDKTSRLKDAISVCEKYDRLVDPSDTENLKKLIELYERDGYKEKASETRKRLDVLLKNKN